MEQGAYFTLECFAHDVTTTLTSGSSQGGSPAFSLAFAFLDYPLLLVHAVEERLAAELHSSTALAQQQTLLRFSCGKSCVFQADPAELEFLLEQVPLHVSLLDSSALPKPVLLASGTTPLTTSQPSAIPQQAPGAGLPHAVVRSITLRSPQGVQVATARISCRLTNHGSSPPQMAGVPGGTLERPSTAPAPHAGHTSGSGHTGSGHTSSYQPPRGLAASQPLPPRLQFENRPQTAQNMGQEVQQPMQYSAVPPAVPQHAWAVPPGGGAAAWAQPQVRSAWGDVPGYPGPGARSMHHPTPPAYPAPFSHNHPHSLQAQQGRVGHSTYGDQGRTSPAAPPPVTAAGSLSDEELDEFAQLEADTRGMLVGRRSLNQVERYLKGHMQESGRAQGHNFQHQQQQVLGGAKRRPGSAQGAAGYGTAQAGIMRGARAGAVGGKPGTAARPATAGNVFFSAAPTTAGVRSKAQPNPVPLLKALLKQTALSAALQAHKVASASRAQTVYRTAAAIPPLSLAKGLPARPRSKSPGKKLGGGRKKDHSAAAGNGAGAKARLRQHQDEGHNDAASTVDQGGAGNEAQDPSGTTAAVHGGDQDQDHMEFLAAMAEEHGADPPAELAAAVAAAAARQGPKNLIQQHQAALNNGTLPNMWGGTASPKQLHSPGPKRGAKAKKGTAKAAPRAAQPFMYEGSGVGNNVETHELAGMLNGPYGTHGNGALPHAAMQQGMQGQFSNSGRTGGASLNGTLGGSGAGTIGYGPSAGFPSTQSVMGMGPLGATQWAPANGNPAAGAFQMSSVLMWELMNLVTMRSVLSTAVGAMHNQMSSMASQVVNHAMGPAMTSLGSLTAQQHAASAALAALQAQLTAMQHQKAQGVTTAGVDPGSVVAGAEKGPLSDVITAAGIQAQTAALFSGLPAMGGAASGGGVTLPPGLLQQLLAAAAAGGGGSHGQGTLGNTSGGGDGTLRYPAGVPGNRSQPRSDSGEGGEGYTQEEAEAIAAAAAAAVGARGTTPAGGASGPPVFQRQATMRVMLGGGGGAAAKAAAPAPAGGKAGQQAPPISPSSQSHVPLSPVASSHSGSAESVADEEGAGDVEEGGEQAVGGGQTGKARSGSAGGSAGGWMRSSTILPRSSSHQVAAAAVVRADSIQSSATYDEDFEGETEVIPDTRRTLPPPTPAAHALMTPSHAGGFNPPPATPSRPQPGSIQKVSSFKKNDAGIGAAAAAAAVAAPTPRGPPPAAHHGHWMASDSLEEIPEGSEGSRSQASSASAPAPAPGPARKNTPPALIIDNDGDTASIASSIASSSGHDSKHRQQSQRGTTGGGSNSSKPPVAPPRTATAGSTGTGVSGIAGLPPALKKQPAAPAANSASMATEELLGSSGDYTLSESGSLIGSGTGGGSSGTRKKYTSGQADSKSRSARRRGAEDGGFNDEEKEEASPPRLTRKKSVAISEAVSFFSSVNSDDFMSEFNSSRDEEEEEGSEQGHKPKRATAAAGGKRASTSSRRHEGGSGRVGGTNNARRISSAISDVSFLSSSESSSGLGTEVETSLEASREKVLEKRRQSFSNQPPPTRRIASIHRDSTKSHVITMSDISDEDLSASIEFDADEIVSGLDDPVAALQSVRSRRRTSHAGGSTSTANVSPAATRTIKRSETDRSDRRPSTARGYGEYSAYGGVGARVMGHQMEDLDETQDILDEIDNMSSDGEELHSRRAPVGRNYTARY